MTSHTGSEDGGCTPLTTTGVSGQSASFTTLLAILGSKGEGRGAQAAQDVPKEMGQRVIQPRNELLTRHYSFLMWETQDPACRGTQIWGPSQS